MRLKRKPVPPKRKKIKKELNVNYFDNLDIALSFFEELSVDVKDVDIVPDWDNINFVWYQDEPLADFHKRVGEYELEAAEYDRWYSENEEAIEEELDLRATKNKQKNLAKLERLNRQVLQARKELERAEQRRNKETDRLAL